MKRTFNQSISRRLENVTVALEELAEVAAAAGEVDLAHCATESLDELLDYLDYLGD